MSCELKKDNNDDYYDDNDNDKIESKAYYYNDM